MVFAHPRNPEHPIPLFIFVNKHFPHFCEEPGTVQKRVNENDNSISILTKIIHLAQDLIEH